VSRSGGVDSSAIGYTKFKTSQQQLLVDVTPRSTLGATPGVLCHVCYKEDSCSKERPTRPESDFSGSLPRMASKASPSDLGSGFCKASSGSRCGRRRQQVAAAGRIASKHACVQKCAPIPVCARACVHKSTTSQRDGTALVCPNEHVTPTTKTDQCTQKAGARHAHQKFFVLNHHPVSRPDKICTHAQTCQRNARRRRAL